MAKPGGWNPLTTLSDAEQTFARGLSTRWDILALAASGCPAEQKWGASGEVGDKPEGEKAEAHRVCLLQGAVNLELRLKKRGAGQAVAHWWKDARHRFAKNELESTELDVLANELKQAEAAAIAEGLIKKGDDMGAGDKPAGERLVPPDPPKHEVAETIAKTPEALSDFVIAPLKEGVIGIAKGLNQFSKDLDKATQGSPWGSAAKWAAGGALAVVVGLGALAIGKRI